MRLALMLACLAGSCDARVLELPLATGTGEIRVLDAGGPSRNTGLWPNVVFAADDTPHLAWCDIARGDLRYATRQAGAWHVEDAVTQGAVGKYASLALDPLGRPAIAYYDQDTKTLRLARRDATWTTEEIAWGLEIGVGAKLLFDAHGVANVFYYEPRGSFVQAWRDSGGWQRKVIGEATGGFAARPSVAATDDGYVMSFIDWDFSRITPLLARPGRAPERLPFAAGFASCLVQNPLRVVHDVAGKHALRLATYENEAWHDGGLVDDVGAMSCAVDSRGEIVLAYEDVRRGEPGQGTLKYVRDGIRYRVDDEGPAGDYVALALDSHGRPLIAYRSGATRSLKIYDETGRVAPPAP